MPLAPFTLGVSLLPKAWGGSRLGPLFGDARDQLGEAWLCADLASTAASGAGGQPMISAIEPSRGEGGSLTDLHAVVARDSMALLGFRAERFPLLLKFLDAAEHLSVQVHPSPAYAAAHPGAHVKSEAWVVLAAEPGAELMLGLRDVRDSRELAEAAEGGTLAERLRCFPAAPGTVCWLPSGLVHALGAGTLVFEVQTASDTTYRLHDWTERYGRAQREMHIEAGVAAALTDAEPVWGRPLAAAGSGVQSDQGGRLGVGQSGLLIDTPDFELACVIGASSDAVEHALPSRNAPRCVLVVPLEHAAVLEGPWGRLDAPVNRVTVVPADQVAGCRLTVSPEARAFVVRVLGGTPEVP